MEIDLNKFLEDFFHEEIKTINQNLKILKIKEPDEKYLKLYPFVVTAFRQLTEIDIKLKQKHDLMHLYNITENIFKLYHKFLNKTRYPSVIFYAKYLPLSKTYNQLTKRIVELENLISKNKRKAAMLEEQLKQYKEEPKGIEALKKYKNLKKSYVDAIYFAGKYSDEIIEVNKQLKKFEETEKDNFFQQFNKITLQIKDYFKKILSNYILSLNKLLWYYAKKSENIKNFFEKSHIKEIGTHAFIKYEIKNIDLDKTKNKSYYQYLKEILKEFKD